MAELEGTVALVTGASAGIGRHLAHGLAARGAAVVGLARSADRLRSAMHEIAAATDARTLAVAADVTDPAAVRAAVEQVTAELGPVTLLVNNAGLIDAAEVPLWEADPDQWWQVVQSQVRGPFLLAHAVLPGMLAAGGGRVIGLASGLGTRGSDVYSAYSAGKSAQMRITEAVHLAGAAHGVRAFDLAPGVVDTGMTRAMAMHAGRTDWTSPEDVVALAVAIAAGQLDRWSGRFLRAGADALATLLSTTPTGTARQLRLHPYGDDDPVG
ncbi:SDR family NAD(P)-dependent oxidoreductase [Modestobacter sp. I12A-02628]|uniref:SDR family oxidoreductase n=1 Tax=Goekera deserti TaxID=2497753 RepID=A0A7K3WJY5_9ACTN|nr:SDR family NAD(P)-dependent oxidoreductase [Goekera deserti]MPQ98989.1 SDR family NAD(P)-dependent oxidoreductase [Goekera deserti]NDI47323.1 SDR family NAD(P)-dependent oxidoreductase [Goekera deserti]NEL55853.1 SDR family oxidoreductase [Goekera deserti]